MRGGARCAPCTWPVSIHVIRCAHLGHASAPRARWLACGVGVPVTKSLLLERRDIRRGDDRRCGRARGGTGDLDAATRRPTPTLREDRAHLQYLHQRLGVRPRRTHVAREQRHRALYRACAHRRQGRGEGTHEHFLPSRVSMLGKPGRYSAGFVPETIGARRGPRTCGVPLIRRPSRRRLPSRDARRGHAARMESYVRVCKGDGDGGMNSGRSGKSASSDAGST